MRKADVTPGQGGVIIATDLKEEIADIIGEICKLLEKEYAQYLELKNEAQALRQMKSDYQKRIQELINDDQSILEKISAATIEKLLSRKKNIKAETESIHDLIAHIEEKALPAIDLQIQELEKTMAKVANGAIKKRKHLRQEQFNRTILEAKDLYEGWQTIVTRVHQELEFRGTMRNSLRQERNLFTRDAYEFFQKVN